MRHQTPKVLLSLLLSAATLSSTAAAASSAIKDQQRGMVLIRGGTFTMGGIGKDARADEFPKHKVLVNSFWIDETEVTNAQFKKFVDETSYVTTAERKISWEQIKKDLPPNTPRPKDEDLEPGSLVFKTPSTPITDSRNYSQWWSWTKGADWKHPYGPDSSIKGMNDHPVVQVSFEDASKYAEWAGKRLPTEAEWEYAARGGLEEREFVWGDAPIDKHKCNVWQGRFPTVNTKDDGYEATNPVKAFKANGYKLFGMAGNVWEWCADRYHPSYYEDLLKASEGGAPANNPTGPVNGFDPRHPNAQDVRVQRGGSFLCNASYCSSYRPSARMSSTPDSSSCHVGFRCVKDVTAPVTP